MIFNLTLISYMWLFILSLFIVVGVYIGYRLCSTTRLLIKMIITLPIIISLIQVHIILTSGFINEDLFILNMLSFLALYFLVAFLLSGKRLLRNIKQQRLHHV